MRVDLVGVHAGGKRAADEPAHAGAGGHVDRDAVLLEPADDADVRESAGAAAAERHTDRWPRTADLARCRLLVGETCRWPRTNGRRPLEWGRAGREQRGRRKKEKARAIR